MAGGGELARREARTYGRVVAADNADVTVAEQALLVEAGSEVGQVADGQVGRAAAQGLTGLVGAVVKPGTAITLSLPSSRPEPQMAKVRDVILLPDIEANETTEAKPLKLRA
jgi:hypothetical protein